MAKRKVLLWGTPNQRVISVDDEATVGAQVGVNLTWPDGTVVSVEQILNDTSTAAVTLQDVTAAVLAHEGKTDPHPQYLTQAEGDARYDALGAAAALVIDSIADADTTHAPSRNAVFDALALKAPLQSPGFTVSVGFNGSPPIAKPTVSGSRGGNAALASLLSVLANYGLITDSTTA